MFNYTALLGAQSTSAASQSLLELDGGVKILIDVGWDEEFSSEKLKALERNVPTISIILLTHATISHLGAYAHCCKHFPLFTRIPTYATAPVISLGRTLIQDLYASTHRVSSIIPLSDLADTLYSYPLLQNAASPSILHQPPTADEIAGYFSIIHPLKFSQSHQPTPSPFSPPLNDLTITAYSAGHTLGGTLWHVQHGMESIVYAVDWNQAKEHVFPGAAWLGGGTGVGGSEIIEALRHPTAMVCSSKGALRVAPSGGIKKRDERLLKIIKDTTTKGGNVLIACDSSARALELAYTLEDAWQEAQLSDKPDAILRKVGLCFASRTCGATMRYARSMLEWMEEGIVREFEMADGSKSSRPDNRPKSQARSIILKEETRQARMPFDLGHMKLIERKSQLLKFLGSGGPSVVLSSDFTLEWGFSRDVLRKIAGDERNTIILTEKVNQLHSSADHVGRRLWERLDQRAKATNDIHDVSAEEVLRLSDRKFSLQSVNVSRLEGEELALYQQYLARQRQIRNNLLTDQSSLLETSADVVDEQSSTTTSTSEGSDIDVQGKAMNVSAALSHSRHKVGLSDAELGINILLRRNGLYDYDVRDKKGRDKVFPFVAKRRRGDDFGDLIRPEEYLRAEERDELDGMEVRDAASKDGGSIGKKRKWGDIGGGRGHRERKLSNGFPKRSKSGGRMQNAKLATGNHDAFAATYEDDFTMEESDEETDEILTEGPHKATFSAESIQLNLRVAYVNFSGLHDKRSLQMLIPMIRPRKLILTGGEEDETLSLADDCRNLLGTNSDRESASKITIYTPSSGDTIDASVDTSAWALKISHALFKNLQWQNVRNLGVVTISGQLQAASADDALEETTHKKLKLTNKREDKSAAQSRVPGIGQDNRDCIPILDVVPGSVSSLAQLQSQPLHVGDLRLADLRKLMQAAGRTAEFRGEGTLLIDGIVAVRKSGTGKIEVESAGMGFFGQRKADNTFFDVRRKVYEGLALVAGG